MACLRAASKTYKLVIRRTLTPVICFRSYASRQDPSVLRPITLSRLRDTFLKNFNHSASSSSALLAGQERMQLLTLVRSYQVSGHVKDRIDPLSLEEREVPKDFIPTTRDEIDAPSFTQPRINKVYYDVEEELKKIDRNDGAICRVEQLGPFPCDLMHQELNRYPRVEIVGCPEEPMNIRIFTYISPHLCSAMTTVYCATCLWPAIILLGVMTLASQLAPRCQIDLPMEASCQIDLPLEASCQIDLPMEASCQIDLPMEVRFEQWMTKFERVYKDADEKAHRFNIFKANAEYVDSANASGERSDRLALTMFADYMPEELNFGLS